MTRARVDVSVQVAGRRCAVDDRHRGESRRQPEHVTAEARPDEAGDLDDRGPASEPPGERYLQMGRDAERQDDVEAPSDLPDGRDGRHHCPQLTEQLGHAGAREPSARRSPRCAGRSSGRYGKPRRSHCSRSGPADGPASVRMTPRAASGAPKSINRSCAPQTFDGWEMTRTETASGCAVIGTMSHHAPTERNLGDHVGTRYLASVGKPDVTEGPRSVTQLDERQESECPGQAHVPSRRRPKVSRRRPRCGSAVRGAWRPLRQRRRAVLWCCRARPAGSVR